MIIIQNAYGNTCRRQAMVTAFHHEQWARQHGHRFALLNCAPPRGLPWHYSKVIAWLKVLRAEPYGTLLLCMDCDVLIVGDDPLDLLLPDYDIGMVRVTTEEGWYYNSGMLWMRNTVDVQRLLEEVLNADIIQGATPGEQARLNLLLSECKMPVQEIGHKYNCYRRTPCVDPVVVAFHGESNQEEAIRTALLRYHAQVQAPSAPSHR